MKIKKTAKKTSAPKDKKPSLKEMLAFMEMQEDDEILIHTCSRQETIGPVAVKDIDSNLLKRKIRVVQPKHGGKDYNYSLYMYFVE